MWDLYWITRLDSIHNFLDSMFTICTILAITGLIAWFIIWIVDFIEDELGDKGRNYLHKLLVFDIWMTGLAILFSLIIIFVPTTKEACMIYLGGNVIEYVQGNEKLKEMPDKVVNLADEYLNELIKQKEQPKDK